jgi:hypothetical protein
MFVPLVKETSHLQEEKIHVTTSLEQINTCAKMATAIKQENSNPIWNRGMSDFYPYSLPGTRVDSIERF